MSDYIQETADCEGRSPTMPKGTRVTFGPDKDPSKQGTVLIQYLHFDTHESFFGNVRVKMDDGREFIANCWQCKKVDQP